MGEGLHWHSVILLGHAFLIGTILMAMTIRIDKLVHTNGNGKAAAPLDQHLNSSVVLFLCMGMAAVMMLVGDNLARAFAIAGAVALVRFRVKMTGRFIPISIFYSVVTGVACGVDRTGLAWMVMPFFGVTLGLVLLTRPRTSRVTDESKWHKDAA